MDPWLLLLISGVAPATITLLGRHLSTRLKALQAARKTDAEIGAELRDELRGELERRDKRIDALETECGRLRAWCLRLEKALNERAPDAFAQLKKDYLDEAAG